MDDRLNDYKYYPLFNTVEVEITLKAKIYKANNYVGATGSLSRANNEYYEMMENNVH